MDSLTGIMSSKGITRVIVVPRDVLACLPCEEIGRPGPTQSLHSSESKARDESVIGSFRESERGANQHEGSASGSELSHPSEHYHVGRRGNKIDRARQTGGMFADIDAMRNRVEIGQVALHYSCSRFRLLELGRNYISTTEHES